MFPDPYTPPEEGSILSYPIGAVIELEFTLVDNPLDNDGPIILNFVFVPDSHTPQQQPSEHIFINSEEVSVRVRYNSATPSLTGDYVLCNNNTNTVPLLCGGAVSLSITGKHAH